MASSVSCGSPLWLDASTDTGLTLRLYDTGTKFQPVGTASQLATLGGVIPASFAALGVTASGAAMTVTVNAGLCVVPYTTAGQGAARFGLMQQGTLTVASNSSGNPRIDLIVAQVHDVASSSSFADVNIITGTPAASPSPPAVPANAIALAQVAVANGATHPGAVTDLRTYTVAPGCVLPIASAAAAPALPASMLLYNQATGKFGQGVPAGGAMAQLTMASFFQTGTTRNSGAPQGYQGNWAPICSQTVSCDGRTDYRCHAKWDRIDTYSDTAAWCTLALFCGDRILDYMYFGPSTAGRHGRMLTHHTSSQRGTTPAAGNNTFTLAAQSNQFQRYGHSSGNVGHTAGQCFINVRPIVR